MTCIEKLRQLHPDWDDDEVQYYVDNCCVSSEYIMPRRIGCGVHGWAEPDDDDCEKCWKREIFEDEKGNKYKAGLYLTGEDMRRLARLAERTGKDRDAVVTAALKLYEDGLDAVDEGMRRVSRCSFEVVMDGGAVSGESFSK